MAMVGNTSSFYRAPVAVLAALLWCAAGCPPRIPPFDPGTVRPERLPNDVPRLLAFARQRLTRDPPGRFRRRNHADALVALDKARGVDPTHHEVLLLGARVARRLGERAASGPKQFKYAELGLRFTRAGRKAFPSEVAFHYYHAALMGLRVDAYRASAFSGVPEIRAAGERALKLDRRFDHAGPLRVLGSLLASVPATAPFHGDVERGTKLLEEAVRLAPGFPLNHYFLAQAYAKDEENAKAVLQYHRVLCAPAGADWDAVIAAKYRALTRKALRALKQSGPPKCK
jgi:tetratricopeptide (TPR) repeat protein